MTDLATLAEELHQNARDKGFYAHEEWLYAEIKETEGILLTLDPLEEDERPHYEERLKHQRLALTEHYGNRFMLISGEAVEAHEEIRSGHGVGHLYHQRQQTYVPNETGTYDAGEVLHKPEGVLMELADVGIRDLETIAGILRSLTEPEQVELRNVLPENSATTYDENGNALRVNTAEVLIHKRDFNAKRAAMHGRKF